MVGAFETTELWWPQKRYLILLRGIDAIKLLVFGVSDLIFLYFCLFKIVGNIRGHSKSLL